MTRLGIVILAVTAALAAFGAWVYVGATGWREIDAFDETQEAAA